MILVANHLLQLNGNKTPVLNKSIKMKYLFIICFLFQFYATSGFSQSYKYHTVKKGETVFSISQSYNLDEEDIYKYNPDSREGIEVNEKLVIPVGETTTKPAATEVRFKEHKVAKKENLYRLSKQYNVSIDDIKRYNKHLYSAELRNGETIRIPINIPEEAVVAQKPVPQPQQKPAQQITKTREHIVIPKETKFGIARKYGMTIKELEGLNPSVGVLQPGMMIKVGTNVLDDQVVITDERFRFYEVQPKENLFRLSQRFGVSQDSLIRLNPALGEGLKWGMILKVPKNPNFDADEDSSYADYEGGEEDNKLDLKKSITNKRTKEIALMLPYHSNKVEADSLATYEDLIMKERVARISLDFYSGVLMAVDEAKSLGISTNLRVFDTRQNAQTVTGIIDSQNFNNVDAVIGPLVQSATEAAAARLQSKNIPVINPLSNSKMKGFSNFFQSRPTEELMEDTMLDYIMRNSAGKNILIVADGKSVRIKTKLSNMLPAARFVNPSGNFLAEDKLAQALTSGQNWIILETTNVNLISSTAAALNRLSRNHKITLLTTNKNNSYDNDMVSNNHLGKLKLHYPAVDKPYDTEKADDFLKKYESQFGTEPNQYAIRGFDLTMDVLLRLGSAENLYKSFEDHKGYTEYHENKFHYLPHMGGGYQNNAVYILNFNEDLTISQANDF